MQLIYIHEMTSLSNLAANVLLTTTGKVSVKEGIVKIAMLFSIRLLSQIRLWYTPRRIRRAPGRYLVESVCKAAAYSRKSHM
jgi:hypothetical protein